VNKSSAPALTTQPPPPGIANACRGTGFGGVLCLDRLRFCGLLDHAGFIHTF